MCRENSSLIKPETIKRSLCEDQYTFLIISRSNPPRMKNVSDKSCKETRTHISCSMTFFYEKHVVYEIMWKNIVESGRPQMTIWRLRIACWIPKATNTHIEVV